jgi:hypothetical protein
MHFCQNDLSPRDSRLLSAFVSRSASRTGYPLKSLGRLRTLLIKLKFELVDRVAGKFYPLKQLLGDL